MECLPCVEVKSKETQTKFNVFWDEAQKFINEDLGVAVDDRRHGEITHLARAISIRDLREQYLHNALQAHLCLVMNGYDCSFGQK